eukprot:TRINITY_DN5093_c1_g1_i3.p2 TRINITY_DN5093_c1_g1~~TRINITY_DN5093_c1_g1_i3.p2  ORF type:complete len:122 (+),score=3.16 TRINITY_DN5093_c1_g1_i3:502-867(+)
MKTRRHKIKHNKLNFYFVFLNYLKINLKVENYQSQKINRRIKFSEKSQKFKHPKILCPMAHKCFVLTKKIKQSIETEKIQDQKKKKPLKSKILCNISNTVSNFLHQHSKFPLKLQNFQKII